jgi:hypothetical protein
MGPSFGESGELVMGGADLCGENSGWCWTKSDSSFSLIQPTPEGWSPLTGEKSTFSIKKLEVYRVTY